MGFFFFILVVFCIVMVAVNASSKERDADRIREYIESRGGEVIELEPSRRTFARSAQQRGDRLYDLAFRDRHGNLHEALCITGFHKKVYFTEDDIVEQAADEEAGAVEYTAASKPEPPPAPQVRDQQQVEIERLRAENEFLRGELQKYTGPLMR